MTSNPSQPGAPAAPDRVLNAFTVDVEEHFQVSGFDDVVDRRDWSSIDSRVENNTRRILDLLETSGVRGTFFVLGWISERYRLLVREISERGHEVACHGMSHKLVYNQSPREFREELRRAKGSLEDAGGMPVVGYRAASFSISRDSLWAIDELVAAGFRYDSSLFPVRHDRYGVPGAPRGIYRIVTGGGTIDEFPPSTVRLGRLVLPVCGGGYLRLYPAWLTHWAIRRLNRTEQVPAMVYVHPWEVDPGQPRIAAPWKSRLRHYTRLSSTEGKLRRLLARHAFGAVSDVLGRSEPIPVRKVS